MSNNRYSIGILIVAVGVLLLLSRIGFFGFIWGLLWPIFILLPGLLLHMLFFGRMLPSGVLIPGGILVTTSIMFFFCNLVGWSAMEYLWPGFLFAVSVGLYEFYLFDKHKPRGALTASIILAVLSALFFGMMILFTVGIYILAFILIAGGAFLIMRPRRSW
ncbi:MAG: hypothetical protein K0R67_1510 [Paenibacillus sp.]|nr:hypothetical protein [Paenibacillus sp.]